MTYMKKFSSIFASVAAIALAALAFTSCDKHAYSISTNHFAYMSGSSVKEIGQNLSIDKGSTLEVFAVDKSDKRIVNEENDYSSSSGDESVVKTYKGDDCIVLEAVDKGSTDVSLNYEIYGFKLYKTVKVTVK